MTEESNIGEFPDFEALMLSKSWAELSPRDLEMMDGMVSGEEEYTRMRSTLLHFTETPDEASLLTTSPETKDNLMNLFDLERGGEMPPADTGRVMRMPRRGWLSVAAAAAFILVIASAWYLVVQNLDMSPHHAPSLASRMQKEEAIPNTDETIIQEDISSDKAQETLPVSGDTLQYRLSLMDDNLSSYTWSTTGIQTDTFNHSFNATSNLSFNATSNQSFSATSPFITDNFFKTEVDVASNMAGTISQDSLGQKTGNDQITVAEVASRSQKRVVSERPVTQKYIPATKLRTSPRPASKDPGLLAFLYTCP